MREEEKRPILLTYRALSKARYVVQGEIVSLFLLEACRDGEEGVAPNCGYALYARAETDEALCFVGCSERRAEYLFRKIAGGKVTPCTLRYVVEDSDDALMRSTPR